MTRRVLRGIGVTGALLAGWSCSNAAHAPVPEPAAPAAIAPTPDLKRPLEDTAWPDELRAFYAAHDWQPVFLGHETVVPALLDSLDAMVADGLPRLEATARARALRAGPSVPDSLAVLDLLLTTAWIERARGLGGGRVVPRRVDPLWSLDPPVADPWSALAAAARDGQLIAPLVALRPTHEGYGRLRAALAASRDAADPRIALNLERWRWLPRTLTPPYVMVHIPTFELQLVDRDGASLWSRVILGRSDRQTPLVQSAVTHVVLAPPWSVPAEIMRREILPLVRADSTYLRRNDFLVYRGRGANPVDPATVDWWGADTLRVRLVQQPGPRNPLGRVKLVFANEFAVALHDTPAVDLFSSADRALSHGCVRVENVMDLTARLLADAPAWDAARLDSVAAEWTTRWIRLPRRVPVYLTYFTAWVDDDGVLRFADDVYGWDAKLAQALGW